MKEKNLFNNFNILNNNEIATAILNNTFGYLEINQKYSDLLKYNDSDLANASFFSHFKSSDTEKVNFIREQLIKNEFLIKEIEVYNSENKILNLELKASLMKFNELDYFLISLKEKKNIFKPFQVSIKKEANYLEKITYLKKILKEQNTYLQMISHEITSPILSIKNLINVLNEKTQDPIDKNYFEMIHKSLDHVLRVGGNLLEISELESFTNLEKTDVELKSFLNEILEEYTPIAFKKNIMLFFNSSVKEFKFKIEKEKFRFAISNLISNAIKFSPKEKMVELKFELENEKPKIQVIDSGIGIADEQKQYLFQKFSKAKRLGTFGEKSTGLGLYIVKEIIEKHSGQISFETKFKVGTTFTITF